MLNEFHNSNVTVTRFCITVQISYLSNFHINSSSPIRSTHFQLSCSAFGYASFFSDLFFLSLISFLISSYVHGGSFIVRVFTVDFFYSICTLRIVMVFSVFMLSASYFHFHSCLWSVRKSVCYISEAFRTFIGFQRV